MIAEAVAAERQRCAAIADAEADEYAAHVARLDAGGRVDAGTAHTYGVLACRRVAAAIRTAPASHADPT